MKAWMPYRGIVMLGWMVAACSGWGQTPGSTLPAAEPTSAAPAAAAVTVATTATANDEAGVAKVTWTGGELTIAAENSSLNQILRGVSKATGMKVTGGVRDERVYGRYGPGTPDAVLVSLLTGTGSNMMLKEDTAGGPMELVLTPRAGGVTPPSPATFASSRERERQEDGAAQFATPQQRFQPGLRGRAEPARPFTPPDGAAGQANQATSSRGLASPRQTPDSVAGDASVTTPTSSASDATTTTTTDTQSSGAAKTPQEIYDQLVKMQQQKNSTPPK